MNLQTDSLFWDAIDRLVAENRIVIDRPAGSRHPRFLDAIFPLDYGYLAGTMSPDREGIDIWIGRSAQRTVSGVICTIDLGAQELELKLLLACTAEDTDRILAFHNTDLQKGWLIARPAAPTAAHREVR